jgi:hypothetical protein
MSDQHKVKGLSKFLQTMLSCGGGSDFAVRFTLKANGTVHDFSMVALESSAGLTAVPKAPYPPVIQALLKACDEVPLHEAHDGSAYLLTSSSEALAKAIYHWRAAKAEGLL